MTKQIEDVPPHFVVRMAGALYVFSLLTAGIGESFLPFRPAYAVGLVAIASMVAVTLLLYRLFMPVNKSLSVLAAAFNLVGLAFEALRSHPLHINFALVFTGVYCILIGVLIVKSTFLPRVLGVLMTVAGLGWLTYISPSLAHSVAPWNLACGIAGELSVFLWLLVKGLNVQLWKAQVSATGESR